MTEENPWDYFTLTMKEIGQQWDARIPYMDVADIVASCPKEWALVKETEQALDEKDVPNGAVLRLSDRLRTYWFRIFDKVEKQTLKYVEKGMPQPKPKPFRFMISKTENAIEKKSTKWIPCSGITVSEWGQYLDGKITVAQILHNIRKRKTIPNGSVVIEDDGTSKDIIEEKESIESNSDDDFASMINVPEEPIKPSNVPVKETDTEVVLEAPELFVEYQ